MNEGDKKKVALIFLIVGFIALAGFGLAWIIARQRDILYTPSNTLDELPFSYGVSYPVSYLSYPSAD